jgi:hypothetical protein
MDAADEGAFAHREHRGKRKACFVCPLLLLSLCPPCALWRILICVHLRYLPSIKIGGRMSR